MITRTGNTSGKNENNAIHEILLKILEKWRSGFLSSETDSEELNKTAISVDSEGIDPLNEKIITETVLLRPEDFREISPSQVISDNRTPVTENEVTQKANEILNSNTLEKTGEDFPETVIVDANIIKKEEPARSDIRQEEIPETVIFSTQQTRDSDVKSDQSKSIKDDSEHQKQENLKSAEDKVTDKKRANQEDIDLEVPETKIFSAIEKNDK